MKLIYKGLSRTNRTEVITVKLLKIYSRNFVNINYDLYVVYPANILCIKTKERNVYQ